MVSTINKRILPYIRWYHLLVLCANDSAKVLVEKLEKLTLPEMKAELWESLRQSRRYKSTSYIAAILSV